MAAATAYLFRSLLRFGKISRSITVCRKTWTAIVGKTSVAGKFRPLRHVINARTAFDGAPSARRFFGR
jgi:hypothetical protein